MAKKLPKAKASPKVTKRVPLHQQEVPEGFNLLIVLILVTSVILALFILR